MYGELFSKLEGGRVLAAALKSQGQNQTLTNALWDVTLAVVADADQRQRAELATTAQLRDVVMTSSPEIPQIRTIRAILQI